MTLMQLMYVANIVVAGVISILSIFFPATAARTLFNNCYQYTDVIRLVGCLWLAITILSIFGLWFPLAMSPVFLVQLIYKSMWLLVVAIPATLSGKPHPWQMALFFVAWVLLLPFAIPWQHLFNTP